MRTSSTKAPRGAFRRLGELFALECALMFAAVNLINCSSNGSPDGDLNGRQRVLQSTVLLLLPFLHPKATVRLALMPSQPLCVPSTGVFSTVDGLVHSWLVLTQSLLLSYYFSDCNSASVQSADSRLSSPLLLSSAKGIRSALDVLDRKIAFPEDIFKPTRD